MRRLPQVGAAGPEGLPSLAAEDRESLGAWLTARGWPSSHAGRILRRYHGSHGQLAADSTELGPTLVARVRERWGTAATFERERVVSADGTTKLLLGLRRGGAVEAVMMPSYRKGEAWCCLSSQVGCAMGCDFCASTRDGLQRNLEVDEIVEQFLAVGRVAAEQGRRLRRLVFMGIGEPLHNLDALLPAIDRIADPGLGGLGWRRVTVSTVGIVHGIERLAEAAHPPFLALSLHAPDDETRARIVPTGRRYDVATLIAAARGYQERTGRIVNLEYCLLSGVNDHDEQARLLAHRLEGFKAHVNLIPYNATGPGLSGTVYERPPLAKVERFLGLLRARGVNAHVRDTRGDDVAAACGQLREKSVSRRGLMRGVVAGVGLSGLGSLGCAGGLDLVQRRVDRVYARGNMETRCARAGQHRIQYHVGGNSHGSPVVLVHGFGAVPSWQWARQVEALAPHHRLLVPELLHFGKSTSSSDRFDLGVQAEMVRDLMHHEGFDRATLVGVSYGGFVSYLLASSVAPWRVDGMVLIDSPPAVMTRADADAMAARFRAKDVVDVFVPETTDDLRRLLEIGYHRPPLAPEASLREVLKREYAPHRCQQRALLESMLADPDALRERLGPVRGATLLIWGEHDQVFPLELARRQLDHLGDAGRLEVIEKAAHAPNMERWEEVNELLRRFLKR